MAFSGGSVYVQIILSHSSARLISAIARVVAAIDLADPDLLDVDVADAGEELVAALQGAPWAFETGDGEDAA